MEPHISRDIPKANDETMFQIIFAPTLSVVLLMLSNSFFTTFTSLFLREHHWETNSIGLIHSLFFFGLTVGAWKGEKIIQLFGHIRSYAACATLYTAVVQMLPFKVHFLFWGVNRFIAGICIGVLYLVIESWLLVKGGPRIRGKILAIYLGAIYIGQSFSQFFIDLITHDDKAFFAAGIFGALSIIPLATTMRRPPIPHTSSGLSLRSMIMDAPFGSLGCLCAGIIISALYSHLPIVAETFSFKVSLSMFSLILGGLALQWPIGHLSDKFDRQKVLIFISLMASLLAWGLFQARFQQILFLPLLFLTGGFLFTIYPVSIAQVCDRIHPEHVTEATGGLLLFYSIGSILGPMGIGRVLLFTETSFLFPTVSILTFCLCALGVFFFFVKGKVPESEQRDFATISGSTPVAAQLDPMRTREEMEENTEENPF